MVDTSRLKKLAEQLKKQKEIETSIKVARKRQLKMLPTLPQVDGYEFKVLYLPASTVSGDFYDIIDVGHGKYGMTMGDVTGHGVEAGLVMGMAIASISIFALGRDSTAEVMSCTNAHLAPRLGEDTFFSASYLILDTVANKLKVSRAGHEPPLLFNPARNPKLTPLSPGGMIIGADRTNKRFSKTIMEMAIDLIPGDVVFQYTDGLSEASNKNKVKFSIAKIEELLEKNGARPLQDILDIMYDSVESFVGDAEQEDDITMTLFKYVGSNKKAPRHPTAIVKPIEAMQVLDESQEMPAIDGEQEEIIEEIVEETGEPEDAEGGENPDDGTAPPQ